MESLTAWEPCFENRHLGVAFFDNLTFETDRLADPRWDSVLPILEEEQILQCRLMRALLQRLVDDHSAQSRPAPKVLDLGTGSGVFAIYAAMLGCDVEAVDISQRAISFAAQNLAKNEDRFDSDGKVKLIHRDYCTLNVDGEYDEKYDVIVVAPPYNPTSPNCHPALYADGGLDGQAKFLELLEIVPTMLKFDGVCLGNHMFTLEGDEFKDRDTFHQRLSSFELNYLRIIEEDIPAEHFIEEQYRTLLRNPKTAKATRTYTASFKPETRFGLAYFELTKTKTSSGLVVNKPSRLGFKATWDWACRIELHRQIIECGHDFAAIPAEHFLSNVRSVPDLIQTNEVTQSVPDSDATNTADSSESKTTQRESTNAWKQSILSLVDQWISNTEFFKADGDVSLVLVDSAPWYPSTKSPAAFKQDCAVWVDTHSLESQENADKLAEEFLCCYQNNTQALQKTEIGPVFHPSFTGKSAPGHWRDIRFTSLSAEPEKPDGEDGTPRPLLYQYAEAYAGEISNEYVSDDDKKNGHNFRQTFTGRDFSPPTKATYTSPDGDTKPAAVIRRSSVLLAALKSPHDPGSIETTVRARAQKLRKGGEWSEEMSEDELLEFDLSICHQAMQLHLDKLTNIVLAANSGTTAKCTFLVSIPVTIGNFDRSTNYGKIPDSFRGGLWIYVVCRKLWSTETERRIEALCRAVYLIADTKYSSLTAEEVRNSESASNKMQFSHTVQSQVRLLKPAINLATESSIREPAQAALRRLQFAVNLFTPTNFGLVQVTNPIPWRQCFDDSAVMTKVKLKARSAFGVVKFIDEAACRSTVIPQETNNRILESLASLLHKWRETSHSITKALGVHDAIEALETSKLLAQWDDDAECGLFTYLLEQAMFHGAVFLSGCDIVPVPALPTSSVVKVSWNPRGRMLTFSNRVLSKEFEYGSTTDFATIMSVVKKFDGAVEFDYRLDDSWFHAFILYVDRKDQQ